MKEVFEVSIIGVGNIGFRYFQAIQNIECIKKINLVEKKIKTLKNKIKNYFPNSKEINITEELYIDLIKSDLIIISTTSSERYQICQRIKDMGYLGDLILEKFLFEDSKTLAKSKFLFDLYPSNIYVNQWMRKTSLKKILEVDQPLKIEIVGENLGLLCNSVHFIDLICETYNMRNFEIDLDHSYIKKIIKSKRFGYSEICGKLVWKDKLNLVTFSLEDKVIGGSNEDVYFKFTNKFENKEYIYSDRELKNINSGEIDFIPYLSEHAIDSIYSILHGKDPIIPKFQTSLIHHNLVFKALSKILKKSDYDLIKIT